MASRVFALVLNPAVSTYAAQGVTGKCDSSVSTYNNFAYDGVFNLTSVDSTIPSTSFGGTDSFTYDSKDRLTAQSSTRNYRYSESFAYDGAGNPTTFSGSARTYNSDNQRTGSGTFAYDGNGNPTTYTGGIFGTATCAYDRENRLTAIGSSWTAGYRADGLRAWKQVGSTKVYYLYDNGNPVMELDSSGNVIAVNGYGADGLYARWWAWNNSATTYYMFDQQGNVAERYDGNGNLISSNMNDAYGNEAYSTYGNDPFGYNAKWGYTYDRETGMFLCQHRYYDPANGRWMTRDPIGYGGGVNVYGYCEQGMVGTIDPTGLATSNEFEYFKGGTRLGPPSRKFCDWLKDKLAEVSQQRAKYIRRGWNLPGRDPGGKAFDLTERRTVPDGHFLKYLRAEALLQRITDLINAWCGGGPKDPCVEPQEVADPEARRFWRVDNGLAWAAGIGIGLIIIVTGGLAAPAAPLLLPVGA